MAQMIDSENTLDTQLTTKLAAAAMTDIFRVEVFVLIRILPYCNIHSVRVRLESCRRELRQSTRNQN